MMSSMLPAPVENGGGGSGGTGGGLPVPAELAVTSGTAPLSSSAAASGAVRSAHLPAPPNAAAMLSYAPQSIPPQQPPQGHPGAYQTGGYTAVASAPYYGTSGGGAELQGLSLPNQPQQPQPHQQLPLPSTTPWTLGSTDGSYATNLALIRLQEQKRKEAEAALSKQQSGSSPPSSPQQKEKKGGASIKKTVNEENEEDVNVQLISLQNKRSLYQERLFKQPSASVEAALAAACEVMSFDISEMWLRTGPKTHQLTNSHLRPTALEESTRMDLVNVYYGDKSSERTHRLSPALCKRAKEAGDVVWVTAHTKHGAEALRCSISNVRTAVAVPVCHEASNTNITIIFFSIRRVVVRPASVEFLVHMALAAGVASVNSLAETGHLDREPIKSRRSGGGDKEKGETTSKTTTTTTKPPSSKSQSEHAPRDHEKGEGGVGAIVRRNPTEHASVTGAPLDLQWRQLQNVEYLTDGGNSWIHTAVFQGRPVVVKTLKPECQDVAVAINEIEGELAIHARLDHPNIVGLIGAGTTSKSVRFVVLERLDGGTLTQMLGYDTRIRDRRRRFWKQKRFSFVDVLRIARSIAEAMMYLHEEASPGCIILHRDLKPDNIGFTLDGTVKVLDFGLAKIVENASVNTKDVYTMSGETGSLRYMAPEVAEGTPYNAAVDVYSFGIILWELNSGKKPFEGLNRDMFYEQVVHGGERPPIKSKWPEALSTMMTQCWDENMWNRPTFRQIVAKLDEMLVKEKGGPENMNKKEGSKRHLVQRLSGMIDRHSTWF